MPAQIAERVMLDPYCTECGVSAQPMNRREAELWAAAHDAEFHPEPEEEDA